jgi:HEAT repeat protein
MTFHDGHTKEQLIAHDDKRQVRPLAPTGEGPFTHDAKLSSRVREYERRLGSDNLTVRIKAMKELSDMGKGAAPASLVIITSLHDDSYRVRELAAETLGCISGPDAENALRTALDHENNDSDGKRVKEVIKSALLRIQHDNIPFPRPEL